MMRAKETNLMMNQSKPISTLANQKEINPIGRDLIGIDQIEIDQKVYDLYDEYCHGTMDKREFLSRSSKLVAGGLLMAQALLPRYVQAQTISFTDSRIKAR